MSTAESAPHLRELTIEEYCDVTDNHLNAADELLKRLEQELIKYKREDVLEVVWQIRAAMHGPVPQAMDTEHDTLLKEKFDKANVHVALALIIGAKDNEVLDDFTYNLVKGHDLKNEVGAIITAFNYLPPESEVRRELEPLLKKFKNILRITEAVRN
jgi:hypothetical protein